ncbi:hypothetical protein BDQ17DRAFT_1190285, partial [Cyathus striatus]
QVENTLYKLHQDFLTRSSEFFNNMFQLPQPAGIVNGSIDGCPIPLPDITIHEFDNFLSWLLPTMSPSVERNVKYWADVLRISDIYVVDRAKQEAKREIRNRAHYLGESPALVMSLALQYECREWYEIAFRVFLHRSVLDISRDEAEEVGM